MDPPLSISYPSAEEMAAEEKKAKSTARITYRQIAYNTVPPQAVVYKGQTLAATVDGSGNSSILVYYGSLVPVVTDTENHLVFKPLMGGGGALIEVRAENPLAEIRTIRVADGDNQGEEEGTAPLTIAAMRRGRDPQEFGYTQWLALAPPVPESKLPPGPDHGAFGAISNYPTDNDAGLAGPRANIRDLFGMETKAIKRFLDDSGKFTKRGRVEADQWWQENKGKVVAWDGNTVPWTKMPKEMFKAAFLGRHQVRKRDSEGNLISSVYNMTASATMSVVKQVALKGLPQTYATATEFYTKMDVPNRKEASERWKRGAILSTVGWIVTKAVPWMIQTAYTSTKDYVKLQFANIVKQIVQKCTSNAVASAAGGIGAFLAENCSFGAQYAFYLVSFLALGSVGTNGYQVFKDRWKMTSGRMLYIASMLTMACASLFMGHTETVQLGSARLNLFLTEGMMTIFQSFTEYAFSAAKLAMNLTQGMFNAVVFWDNYISGIMYPTFALFVNSTKEAAGRVKINGDLVVGFDSTPPFHRPAPVVQQQAAIPVPWYQRNQVTNLAAGFFGDFFTTLSEIVKSNAKLVLYWAIIDLGRFLLSEANDQPCNDPSFFKQAIAQVRDHVVFDWMKQYFSQLDLDNMQNCVPIPMGPQGKTGPFDIPYREHQRETDSVPLRFPQPAPYRVVKLVMKWIGYSTGGFFNYLVMMVCLEGTVAVWEWLNRKAPWLNDTVVGNAIQIVGAVAVGGATVASGFINYNTITFGQVLLGVDAMVRHFFADWLVQHRSVFVLSVADLMMAMVSVTNPGTEVGFQWVVGFYGAVMAHLEALRLLQLKEQAPLPSLPGGQTPAYKIQRDQRGGTPQAKEGRRLLLEYVRKDLAILNYIEGQMTLALEKIKAEVGVLEKKVEALDTEVVAANSNVQNAMEKTALAYPDLDVYGLRLEHERLFNERKKAEKEYLQAVAGNTELKTSYATFEQEAAKVRNLLHSPDGADEIAKKLKVLTWYSYMNNVVPSMSVITAVAKTVKADTADYGNHPNNVQLECLRATNTPEQLEIESPEITLEEREKHVKESQEKIKGMVDSIAAPAPVRWVGRKIAAVASSPFDWVYNKWTAAQVPREWTNLFNMPILKEGETADQYLEQGLTVSFAVGFLMNNFPNYISPEQALVDMGMCVRQKSGSGDLLVLNSLAVQKMKSHFRQMIIDSVSVGWWTMDHGPRPAFPLQSMLLFMLAQFHSRAYGNGVYTWDIRFIRTNAMAMTITTSPNPDYNLYSFFLLYPDNSIPEEAKQRDQFKNEWNSWGREIKDPTITGMVNAATSVTNSYSMVTETQQSIANDRRQVETGGDRLYRETHAKNLPPAPARPKRQKKVDDK